MKGDIWRRRRSTLKCVFLSCIVVQINKAFAAFQHPHIPRFKDEAKKPTKEAAGSKLHQWHTGLLKVYLFFKRAFILKDNQRRSICQQARVPSHSSEGADMGVRKHISRLSLSQSLSHFRTHSFPQFEKKRGHTCVHSTQNRKDCVEETLIIALGFNAKWDRHCPTPALF